ncbi:hypothetical protein NL526_30275, partial [Klebsiella pneumoniae]|nr:hypothetical protein [Klebsiella pneumoniae]
IVKKLPEDTMTVNVVDGFQTQITSGAASFTINGLDPENYPLAFVRADYGLRFRKSGCSHPKRRCMVNHGW